VRSVDSEEAGHEESAPKSFLVAEADAVIRAEGRIGGPLCEVLSEPPESLARGTLSKGFPRNLRDLSSPPMTGMVPPDPKGPGPGRSGCTDLGSEGHPVERYRASRETGDDREGQRGVLRTHSTGEGGEPVTPGPTGGRGGTGRRIDCGKHDDTQKSEEHVNGTQSNI